MTRNMQAKDKALVARSSKLVSESQQIYCGHQSKLKLNFQMLVELQSEDTHASKATRTKFCLFTASKVKNSPYYYIVCTKSILQPDYNLSTISLHPTAMA